MTDNEKVAKVLRTLISTCRDGQNGYRDAAEHVTDTNLRQFFNGQSLERAGFAGELEQELLRLGDKDPDRLGSVGGAIRRAWIDVKTTLGGGDKALLSSVESGEDAAKNSYQDVLANGGLPQHIASIVRRQLVSIQAAHDHVRSLRDVQAA